MAKEYRWIDRLCDIGARVGVCHWLGIWHSQIPSPRSLWVAHQHVVVWLRVVLTHHKVNPGPKDKLQPTSWIDKVQDDVSGESPRGRIIHVLTRHCWANHRTVPTVHDKHHVWAMGFLIECQLRQDPGKVWRRVGAPAPLASKLTEKLDRRLHCRKLNMEVPILPMM